MLKKIDLSKNRLLTCFGIVCFAFMFVPVFAGIADAVIGWVANMVNSIVTDGLTNDTLKIFSDMPANMAATSGAWGVVRTVNIRIIRPFAYSLVGLCFAIKLTQMGVDFERMLMTPERILGPILQMAVAMFLVSQSFFITEKIIEVGVSLSIDVHDTIISLFDSNVRELFETLTTALEAGHSGAGGLIDSIGDVISGRLWQAVLAALTLILPWLISTIINMLTKIAAYGVIIELLVRASFVPLFAGDVMLHGVEGRGFGVIKGFLAACCQGAVFVMVAGIVNAMKYDAMAPAIQALASSSAFNIVVDQIASSAIVACIYSGAGLALMLKSSEIVRSVFGET